MKEIRSLALASLFVLSVASVSATTITESFTNNPSSDGWQIFGDTNLFHWDSAHQNLAVTWDSSQTNSYFYRPLGTILTKNDDFSIAFDLRLNDFAAGIDPQMPGPFPLSVGFLNLAEASRTNFLRGTGYNSPDLVEFSFFPDPGGAWAYGPSLTDVLVDKTGLHRGYGSDGDNLTTNDVYRVTLNYTAGTSNLVMTITRNNQMFVSNSIASFNTNFTDFYADTISVSSYSQAGQDTNDYGGIIYAGSILAHGTVDNFVVTVPPPAIQNLAGAVSNGVWQTRFTGRADWLYTLQRTTDFQSWTDGSPPLTGVDGMLILPDTNGLADKAFYRVRAGRP